MSNSPRRLEVEPQRFVPARAVDVPRRAHHHPADPRVILGMHGLLPGFNWGFMELNGIYYDLLGFD